MAGDARKRPPRALDGSGYGVEGSALRAERHDLARGPAPVGLGALVRGDRPGPFRCTGRTRPVSAGEQVGNRFESESGRLHGDTPADEDAVNRTAVEQTERMRRRSPLR